MAYRVDLTPVARRELGGLDSSVRERILRALIALETNPRPPRVKKLKGDGNYWRTRLGDYRVIYEIRDDALVVLVVRIAHRREAYR
ncbi:MAG TPA: type II toxin-antitoxin system RelE/ParE family toxin [Candidatus Binataceae bacterium]|nr:type II toxin-antitoxin system RelE/ParE family toxin [Candidatus Binataceae bacterium]